MTKAFIYKVWYMKNQEFRDFNTGLDFLMREFPDKVESMRAGNLKATHTLVIVNSKILDVQDNRPEEEVLEEIYMEMQGESWSPNGEAKWLLKSLDIGHTSMSIGDIVETENGVYIVDVYGFSKMRNGIDFLKAV